MNQTCDRCGPAVRAEQGPDDPFRLGRCRPTGPLGLRLVLLWPGPGVIITQAAHRRPTGSRRLDGGRGRARVPGPTGGAALAAVSVCPVPGAGRGGGVLGSGPAGVPGLVVQARGLDNRGIGPVRAVLIAVGG